MTETELEGDRIHRLTWSRLGLVAVACAWIYVLLEWLFLVTKPSFLRTLSFGNQLAVLFFSASLAAALSLIPVLALAAASHLPYLRKLNDQLIQVGAVVPAAVLGSLLLLLIDNFTYTLFKFGIVSTQGILRGIYALVFLLLVWAAWRLIAGQGANLAANIEQALKPRVLFAGMVLIILAPLILPVLDRNAARGMEGLSAGGETGPLPHILLVTGDGISAGNLSLYGYERQTTPNIDALAETSLVAENAFSNSENTAGSIISFLTGRYPTDTRVLYPPDILQGMDAFEHLPGLLKAWGYYSEQISYPHYVDAYALNVQGGFDKANGRVESTGFQLKLRQFLPNDYAYFIYETGNRLGDRLRHIFYIKKMDNPYDLVTKKPQAYFDQDKFDELHRLLQTSDPPLFVHLHAMGTHGPLFSPADQVFSAGKAIEDQESWDSDFYDDSILEFDRSVGELLDELKISGLYDQTILIIASDHPQRGDARQRIPFLIHFPGGVYAGRLRENVQAIDIAPTVLDFMGVEIPAWMSGQSLIEPGLDQRPIFNFGIGGNAIRSEGVWVENPATVKPPFYQFGTVSLEYCQNWYSLDLKSKKLTSGEISGSTASCPTNQLPNNDTANQWMIAHLQAQGFDTSSLP